MSGNVSEQRWQAISDITITSEHKLGEPSPLFAKVESSDIKTHKEKLGKQS
jgi:methionyl-tRNA synthetase